MIDTTEETISIIINIAIVDFNVLYQNNHVHVYLTCIKTRAILYKNFDDVTNKKIIVLRVLET